MMHLSIRHRLRKALLILGLLVFSPAAVALSLSLSLDGLHSEPLSASRVRVHWQENGRAELGVGELRLGGATLREVRLSCGKFAWSSSGLACEQGTVAGQDSLRVSLHYRPAPGELDLAVDLGREGRLQLRAEKGRAGWQGHLVLDQVAVSHLSSWLPGKDWSWKSGRVSGRVDYVPERGGKATAVLTLTDLTFSDAAGNHAGEGIGATLRLTAQRARADWRWEVEADWGAGEVFWQPFYFKAGHRLAVQGVLSPAELVIDSATLVLAGAGEVKAAATWDRGRNIFVGGHIEAEGARLAGLYEVLFKPLLEGSALSDLETEGEVDFSLDWRDGSVRGLHLRLRNVHGEDRQGRFALYGLEGDFPWRERESSEGWLALSGGHVRSLPFGALRAPFRIDREGVIQAPLTAVAVAGGWLEINGFSARKRDGAWRWRFGGQLADASMEQLSSAFGWPVMHGTLSAGVPTVSYDGQLLAVGGLLVFRVFDGTVLVKDLRVRDPLGPAPVLTGGIEMRNLDLDLLTSTFSFGSITGRLDVDVKDLELVRWRPSRFDARVASSAGDYPKRISQRAVQNISSLGGAGAGAAIQRSFLRFFEQFGYERIGLSCALRNGVCLMDGAERDAHGYVIVKGGGIPAITVMGYNRQVGWDELLSRLSRVTEKNFKPIIE